MYVADGQYTQMDIVGEDKLTKTCIMHQLQLKIGNQFQTKRVYLLGRKGVNVPPDVLLAIVLSGVFVVVLCVLEPPVVV